MSRFLLAVGILLTGSALPNCQENKAHLMSALAAPIKGGDTVMDQRDSAYMVAIEDVTSKKSPKGIICGGALISEKHVLTAAHCVAGHENNPSVFLVMVGSISRGDSGGGKRYKVKAIEVREKFDDAKRRNDVAVLLLDESVEFSKRVVKIQLTSADEQVLPPSVGTLEGWGDQSTSGTPSFPLRRKRLSTEVVDKNLCSKLSRPVTDDNICTDRGTKAGSGTGDSGGPLVINNVAVGVASWHEEKKIVFARVSSFRKWIDEQIANLN